MNPHRNCLYVTGFNKDVDRGTLLNEFENFGAVTKLFIHPSWKYAKVYFLNRRSAEEALDQLNNSLLNWQVSYPKKSENNMAHYNDDYDDGDFSENFDYCTIHGHPLVVLQADSGDLYVNLKDIRKTGFAIFRKDTFDSILVDTRQIGKEFELHLLSEAKNYILKNRVGCIDEQQILNTIERCKTKLLGDDVHHTVEPNRSISQTTNSITVTSSVEETRFQSFQPISQSSGGRPPRTLPNNFVPTQVQRGEKSKTRNFDPNSSGPTQVQRRDKSNTRNFDPNSSGPTQVQRHDKSNTRNFEQQQGRGDYPRHNGAGPFNSTPKFEKDFNSSSSSEKSSNYRKSRFEEGSRPPKSVREEVPKITLEEGVPYNVTVSFKEKDNICWVQDHRYSKEMEEVIIQVNELVNDLEPITPAYGQLVAAEFEGMWNRGRVFKLDPIKVHFLDYGNKAVVDLVKPLPDALKSIPSLALRVALSTKVDVKEEMDLRIKVKQQYDDGTYLVNVLDQANQKFEAETVTRKPKEVVNSDNEDPFEEPVLEETPEKAKQKVYLSIPKPLTQLQDGDKVMLIHMEGNKFYVRTKECALKSKAITEYIKNLDKSALPLSQIKVGQLVLCSQDGYAGLFRAVVVKRDNELIVTVKYIDFPGEAELSVKSLRNVDDFLAKEPTTLLLTPEFQNLENLDLQTSDYVANICQNKQKFTVVMSEGGFDLEADDGSLLSNTLMDLKSPKPKPKKTTAVAAEPAKTVPAKTAPVVEPKPAGKEIKVFYDEMDYIKIDPGSYSLMCYCLQDIDDITFLSSTDEVITHLETVTNASPSDEDPYEPELSEMCLVSYKGPDDDEATWYRSVVFSVDEDKYTVSFVDFGNIEVAARKDIRKFPVSLKDVPILGIGCSCVGLPKTPKILDRLKELIQEGSQVEVNVKELDGLKYLIELPEVYKQLKAEKLF